MTNTKIITIITDNPKTKHFQKDLLCLALNSTENEKLQKSIVEIYSNTKITSRYLDTLDFYNKNKFFKIDERMNYFKSKAIEYIVDIVETALKQSNLTNNDIHKIIFISSTCILAPSLDIEIIKKLKLPNTIERTNILFMGCAAGIMGIKNAYEYLKGSSCRNKDKDKDKSKNVLMISMELSSIHIHFKEEINNIITHSIFSDGFSATILSSNEQNNTRNNSQNNAQNNEDKSISVLDTFSYAIDDTEDGIVLSIDEYSISCNLSKNLPKYIQDNILYALNLFLEKNNLSFSDIGFWAVHPGGRKIIESVQKSLNLTDEQLHASWNVLDNFGNMLSVSIMFVLKEFMNTSCKTQGSVYCIAFSFSPGVGIEFILLKKE
jgi:alpha-pyrone synthase